MKEELEQRIRRAFDSCEGRPMNYPGSGYFETFRLGYLSGLAEGGDTTINIETIVIES